VRSLTPPQKLTRTGVHVVTNGALALQLSTVDAISFNGTELVIEEVA
jgi:hypothetical protein